MRLPSSFMNTWNMKQLSEKGNEIRSNARNWLMEARCVKFIPVWMTQGRAIEYSITELAGHASFILVAVSYATDDFLLLRTLAVAGSSSMLIFTYFHPHGRVLWLPFRWNLLFIIINSYRIGRVLWDKWEVRNLREEELKLHHDHFQLMDLVDFTKLLKIGEIETFDDCELVIDQGEDNRSIRLVLSGQLDVFRDGTYTYTLEEGNFMSEAGLHIGMRLTGSVESSGGVVSRGKCRCIKWDRTELMELLDIEKDLRRSFLSALSWDIIGKLKGQRRLLMNGKVKFAEQWTEKRNNQSDHRYASLLKNILSRSEGLSPRSRYEIDNYRAVHHIDDAQHENALSLCGWSLEEFASGQKLIKTPQNVNSSNWGKNIFSWFSS